MIVEHAEKGGGERVVTAGGFALVALGGEEKRVDRLEMALVMPARDLVSLALRASEPQRQIEPVERRLRPGEIERRPRRGIERGGKFAPWSRQRRPQLEQAPREQRLQERALVAEMMIERRLGDAHGFADLLHADAVVAEGGEQFQRVVDEARARVGNCSGHGSRIYRSVYPVEPRPAATGLGLCSPSCARIEHALG